MQGGGELQIEYYFTMQEGFIAHKSNFFRTNLSNKKILYCTSSPEKLLPQVVQIILVC
jgi:hypothetical protein